MIDHCSRTGVVVARDVGTLDVHRLDLDQREATLPSSEDAPESETFVPVRRSKWGQNFIDAYHRYTDQMYEKLPQLFGRLPKAK